MNEIYIALEDCVDRAVYKLRSRNLRVGVYSSDIKSFIGIRTKFNAKFLDSEYHWDVINMDGKPYGTAKPLEMLAASIPENITLNYSGSNPGLKDLIYKFLENV